MRFAFGGQEELHDTFVIAEAGVNHNGSLKMALDLVAAAKNAGADAVKFQVFSADRLAAPSAPKAAYQRSTQPGDEYQREMLRQLELTESDFEKLQRRSTELGIEFLASPFDELSADVLARLGLATIKIPSGEITNLPLLRHIGEMKKEVILSTGMSWLGEVETAVRTIQAAGTSAITLLHCVTEYPAPAAQINLRAMRTLREAFGLPVGYSDHSSGIEVAIAAVALGAAVIEKHLTLDTSLPGPDHKASLDPSAFAAMVEALREVGQALGTGRKAPAPCETANIVVARKSIVAARALKVGQVIALGDLAVKRPGSGIPPSALEAVIGRHVARAVAQDQVLAWADLS